MKRIFLTILAQLALIAPVSAQTATTGLVSVRLPRDARLYVDDVFCPLPGEVRSFETPPLDAGKRYYYELRIEITVDGKPLRTSKRAIVQAGRRSDVDFGTREEIIAATPKTKPEPMQKVADPPALPQGFPPVAALAKVDGEFLVLTRAVFEEITTVEKRTRNTPDGKTETYDVQIKKRVSKPVNVQVKFDAVKAIEAPGSAVTSAKLRDLLAKEMNVYLSDEPTVDPVYVRALKDGTLILTITRDSPTIKPTPIDPPQPVEKDGEPRASSDPPLLVKAWFQEGFILWKQTETAIEQVTEKVTKKGPDGKEIVESVYKKVPVQKEFVTKVDAKTAKVATVGGRVVDTAELAKRLEKASPIIFSESPIAPFHLQLYDADAITVVAPRAPLPAPSPPEKGPKVPKQPVPQPIEQPKS